MMIDKSQDLAQIRDTIPRLWWSLYQGCLATGFSEGQAMVLIQTWILSQCGAGIRPPATDGPRSDQE